MVTSAFSGPCPEERWGGVTPGAHSEVWGQTAGASKALCPAEKWVPTFESWAATRCRELCFLVSPSRPVSLCSVFTSPPLANIIKRTGLPPGLCLYHCKLLKVLEELQYVVKLSPSYRGKNWGIWLICCPFTSVEKTVRSTRECRIRCLFSQLQRSLSFFLCIFLLSMSPCPTPSIFPLFSFWVFLNILLSIIKPHSCVRDCKRDTDV